MRRAGHSLIEIMVVMGLMLVLMTCVYFVVIWGMEYYLTSSTSLQVRQETLVGLTLMTTELRESNVGTMHYQAGPPSGLIFSSPRDPAGQIPQTWNGNLEWCKIVCYYLGPPDPDGAQLLLRQEQALPAYIERPPDALGLTPIEDVAFFQGLASPRTISHQVQTFNVSIGAKAAQIGIVCSLSARYQYTIDLRTVVVPLN